MEFPVRVPFVEELGMELHRFEGGEAEVSLRITDRLCNSFIVAHGGVLMSMLDVAMAHAARSANLPPEGDGHGVVTIEMKTSFMRPGEGELRATGKLLSRTAQLAFTEGRVLDTLGQLCAHATATFKYLRAVPVRREVRSVPARLAGDGSD